MPEGSLVCFAVTVNKWVGEKMVTTETKISKMSCALCPHAHQSVLHGTFQVEAEDLKHPRKRESPILHDHCLHSSLFSISRAHLGIFQATPIGTILPL